LSSDTRRRSDDNCDPDEALARRARLDEARAGALRSVEAMRATTERRFRGRILGVGTTSGTRLVVGLWDASPFGPFTDVFVERADGSSLLLAPDDRVAEYVSGTYAFDAVHVVDVSARRTQDALRRRRLDLVAGPLRAHIDIGGASPLGLLLGAVPVSLATSPTWLAAIDPVARLLVPGAGTAGSAGNGRREYYGVTGARRVTGITGTWGDTDLGSIAPLDPPVRFGFASMPSTPQIVTVTSIIREPKAH
jgi:hypothetical protein